MSGRDPSSLGAVLEHGQAMLMAAGIVSASMDARLLLRAATGFDAHDLILLDGQRIPHSQRLHFEHMLARRSSGEPVARILGRKGFWDMELALGSETLDPRPDTETLVEQVLRWLDKAGRRAQPLRILDLGTGSGAILIALLRELPQATGVGLDKAFGAVAVARQNAEAAGVGGRAVFVAGHWGDALAAAFDVVVSNPPYIRSDDIHALAPEVRLFDPLAALDGGADGLDAYRALCRGLPGLMAGDGFAALELGRGQAPDVSSLAGAAGLSVDVIGKDLAGIDRVLLLSKKLR